MLKIIISLLFLTSCSTSIKVRTPTSKFLTAKSQGKLLAGNIKLYFIQSSEAEVDLENTRTDNSLVVKRDTLDSPFTDIGLSGEIGIWGPIDLVHISGGSFGADMTGIKVQFLGQNWTQSSKSISAAIIAGFGNVSNEASEGEDIELVPLDDDTETDLAITNQTVALVLGYDISPTVHLSLGHYYVNHNFNGELDSQNSSLDGERIDYRGKGNTTTFGVQVRKGAGILGLEFAHEVLEWENTDATNLGFINLSAGFQW